MTGMLHIGLDVGSTTVKIVLLDEQDKLVYSRYTRHYAEIRGTIAGLVGEAFDYAGDWPVTVMVTGSAGLAVSQWLSLAFEQEVIACNQAVERFIPWTDVVIELGGEDAKITFFDNGIEQRMNGTCAGGTGAFIDQMATLLGTDAAGSERLGRPAPHHLPDRRPLRRVRQDRHPAAAERGGRQGGHRRLGLPVGGQPDHQRPGLRQVHQRQGGLPGRAALLPVRAAAAVHRDPAADATRRPSSRSTPSSSWPSAPPWLPRAEPVISFQSAGRQAAVA